MKALRIVLTQNKAHYRKEESITNKMTYPLPPFSTVIGALHNACKFKEYHPMDLSIQGTYSSLMKQPYTDYCFLNSIMDDRGILVKMKNNNLISVAFDKVAVAKKGMGNSFRKGITIEIKNQDLMDEYRGLKDLNDEISNFKRTRIDRLKKIFKVRKKTLLTKKKSMDKKSLGFKMVTLREKEIKRKEKQINERVKEFEYNNYTKEISKYNSLTTSLKYYEILHNVNLIIHIKTDDETLKIIKENIYNLKSIGRSEDFVDIEQCEIVELTQKFENDLEYLIGENSAYLDHERIKEEDIILKNKNGTKYFLNKDYEIVENKRVFNKKVVIYTSGYSIDDKSEGIYIDTREKENGGTENYIVNFI
ncbi:MULTISPECIES: CRISPR-associated protein Cas5 [Psychrilyobacter]|uniref:CRISPR-associated protein Cas5 n=1 Tax=Psychrilyobacter piezotolerans TaxID=2293438 RepID=A0ABX9KG27_9FUSO|nr:MULTISPECIES: CRISPR-associated protein Cas5 [Psychrilyobacter]MCS5420969.1 CRISPR-associated protein Cas5 [Psychrilyobacter sp. S5]NDI78770.1 CRISPR-associated protein Cas5 [Psychrilyobacter piezotolerans]RDE60871.1 CRISPR-associated protein Cas5 [Psychrilyobacter sp. S5]REI40660.1 CRISPR-associated protein Cas5 [Psychrilyobacter piezotolerans]